MNIRHATQADITAVVQLGRSMRDESPRFAGFDYDDDTLEATLRQVVDSPNGLLLLAERDESLLGFMIAAVIPSWFGRDCMATDLALFIHPEFRGGTTAARLIDRYKRWAKDKKANPVLLGIMTGVNVEQTEKLCIRLGWRRAGVVMEC